MKAAPERDGSLTKISEYGNVPNKLTPRQMPSKRRSRERLREVVQQKKPENTVVNSLSSASIFILCSFFLLLAVGM